MIKRFIYLFLLSILLVGTATLAYLLTTRASTFPEAQAILKMTSGKALVAPDGQPIDANSTKALSAVPGSTVQLGSHTRLKVDGTGTLIFLGTKIDLIPGVELVIKDYRALDQDAQIELVLINGQLTQHIDGYPSARSYYKLTVPAGTMIAHGGDFFAHISTPDTVQVASIVGVADFIAQGRVTRLSSGEGATVKVGEAAEAPSAWSQVYIPTYKPDGSMVTVPITLIDERTNDRYHAGSNQVILVPPATYTLEIETLTIYRIPSLTAQRDGVNEFPITLGELVFTTTTNSQITSYKALIVKGIKEVRVVPDESLLVSPSVNNLVIANEDQPEDVQPVAVDVGPGQRYTLPLQTELFGGGFIKVELGTPDGNPVAPVSVLVYTANNEDGDPVATFKSDTISPLLPTGNYIVSVRTQLAGRYPLTIEPNQSKTLAVPLGYINVDYTDPSGKSINRTAFVYIASIAEMQRLGQTPDQMRRTPYGLGVAIGGAKQLLVPAGTYSVMVDDRVDVTKENIKVESGQTVTVQLQVSTQ